VAAPSRPHRHFGVYAILAFFMRWSLGWVHTWRPFESAVKNGLPVVVCGIYGAGLELLQETIDARAGEILDAVADATGALAMVWVLSYALPRTTRRTRALVARLG
jgi:VanZ family protein